MSIIIFLNSHLDKQLIDMDKRDVIGEDLEEIASEISGVSRKLEGKTVVLAGGAGF